MKVLKYCISILLLDLISIIFFAENDVLAQLHIDNDKTAVFINGLSYKISNGSAMVVNDECYKEYTRIDIPSKIMNNGEQFVVNAIADYAFRGAVQLDSIIIPESVNSIGFGAFNYCNQLSYIRIQNPIVTLSIGNIFSQCSNLPSVNGIRYADNIAFDWDRNYREAFSIREGTTAIAPNAFYEFKDTFINIPKSVRVIGADAFCESRLSSIVLPDSLVFIGSDSFGGCVNLTSIFIPKGVVELSGNICSNCPMLKTIEVAPENTKYDSRNNCNAVIESATNILIMGCSSTIIPETVVEISEDAFSIFSGQKKIYLPASVKKISRLTFRFSGLEEIAIDKNNPYFESRNNAIIEKSNGIVLFATSNAKRIPNGVNGIGDYAYEDCNGLKDVKIPGSVMSIGEGAFEGSALESINMTDNVSKIGDYAFRNCNNIKSVRLSDNISILYDGIFSGCRNLQFVKLPKLLLSIPSRLFWECPNIRQIEIPESVQSIGEYAFSGTRISGIWLQDSVQTIGENAFSATQIKKIRLPGSLRIISKELFDKCKDLSSVIMPERLDSICDRAFARCKSLKDIVIPEGTQKIGNQAFWGTGLESVTIPESVTQIGNAAFSYCQKLELVEILGQIEHMGAHVFNHDGGLRTIKLSSSQPPYVEQGDALYDYKPLFENCTLYVPSQCIGQYRESPFWGQFKNIEPLTK